jgi:hypothetical protein
LTFKEPESTKIIVARVLEKVEAKVEGSAGAAALLNDETHHITTGHTRNRPMIEAHDQVKTVGNTIHAAQIHQSQSWIFERTQCAGQHGNRGTTKL